MIRSEQRMSDSVGECESHNQLMSKFVILNKAVIDKVSNYRRQEGSEGGWMDGPIGL